MVERTASVVGVAQAPPPGCAAYDITAKHDRWDDSYLVRGATREGREALHSLELPAEGREFRAGGRFWRNAVTKLRLADDCVYIWMSDED